MSIFNANDVLNVTVEPHGNAGVWFLNWKIQPKPLGARTYPTAHNYAGAGLYGLCFDNNLIYIGSFLGNERGTANFGGDVVASRWWTHIGAITARGHRMHIARKSLHKLQACLERDHIMLQGFNDADKMILHQDAGNLGPLRRLLFAAQHADIFFDEKGEPEKIFSRFHFLYHRLSCLPADMDAKKLKAVILNVEKTVIQKFEPVCNSTHIKSPTLENRHDLAQVDKFMKETMGLLPIG